MKNRDLKYFLVIILFCLNCAGNAEQDTDPVCAIRLGTFSQPKDHAVTDLHIYSPWNPEQYANLAFPEHCWGRNLPNTSHNSRIAVASPWKIDQDSINAVFEYNPWNNVTFRASAAGDSMAVALKMEIINNSSNPITNIHALVCFKPDGAGRADSRKDAMVAFRDTSFEMSWFPVDGVPVKFHDGTHFSGEFPDQELGNTRYRINWGVNVAGGPDNRVLEDIGWFRDKGPGRIVDEIADPALYAVHARGDTTRWVGIIWEPARILFCNPTNPCFHSDPAFDDCPPGGISYSEGTILYHDGSLTGLIERAALWRDSVRDRRKRRQ